MQTRPLFLSAIAVGLACGAVLAQGVPVVPRSVSEPAWRALIQPQYRFAYSPPSYGQGPEDSTGAGLALASYSPTAVTRSPAVPDYAEMERLARTEIRAAREAERRYHLAYADAVKPVPAPEPLTDQVVTTEVEPAPEPQPDPAEPEAEPKIVTVAALDAT